MAYEHQIELIFDKASEYGVTVDTIAKHYRTCLRKIQTDRVDLNIHIQFYYAECQTWYFFFENFPGIEPSSSISDPKVINTSILANTSTEGGLVGMTTRHENAAKKIYDHAKAMNIIAKQSAEQYQSKCNKVVELQTLRSSNTSTAGLEKRIKKLEGELKHERNVTREKGDMLKALKKSSGIQKEKFRNLGRKVISKLERKGVDVTKLLEDLKAIDATEELPEIEEEDVVATTNAAVQEATDSLFVN
ncbi:uncharacterized protein LY89DRAFT_770755 [Mollisia scopiformis]|uniref:Uncharacterized protein n=1 Tax=Mollisia scopiformis TaxID=149040 RepID=A0A194XMS7_MOLSC|nr:uncharacterized protein LY89DRAFT_770755 [Mollisia scopiformis]KUJ21394.1 hypothetical protein LY89DRAFT_770755 [Mollisia scopiformis]